MVVIRTAVIWMKEQMLRWLVCMHFVTVSSSLQLQKIGLVIETGMNVWNLTKAVVQQPSPPILIPYFVIVQRPSPPILIPYFVKQVEKIQIKSRIVDFILTSEFCEWLLEGLEIQNTAKCPVLPVACLSLFKVWHKKYVLSSREQNKRDCRWLFGWLQPCWCIVHLLPLIVNC